MPPAPADARHLQPRGERHRGEYRHERRVCEAAGARVTAVIGDISFLHDVNSLLLLRQSETPVILVVINNGGGRIFERLPIGDFPEMVDPYLITPHAMDFHHLAEQFSLPYFPAGTADELAAAYGAVLAAKRSAFVEVTLSRRTICGFTAPCRKSAWTDRWITEAASEKGDL